MQQQQHGAFGLRQPRQRGWDGPRVRTAAVVEQIDDRHRLVHTDDSFTRGVDVAANEREMR